MSSFTAPIVLSFDHDLTPRFSRVTALWTYSLTWTDDSDYVQVDKGFVTDGVSTPILLKVILSSYDQRSLKAAITHDTLYATRLIRTVDGNSWFCTQKQADKMFFDMLKIGGKEWVGTSKMRKFTWGLRIRLAYWGLRAFGFLAWRKHRKAQAR